MTWPAKLLSFALALPVWGCPEPKATRDTRISLITSLAIEVTAEPVDGWSHRQRAALLLTKISAESGGFRLDVHDGRKRGDSGRSICLGQIQYGPWISKTHAEWEGLAGTDEQATRRCLTEAWRQLQLHRRLCASHGPSRERVAAIYSSYGTGRGCSVRSWARTRARTWARLVGGER